MSTGWEQLPARLMRSVYAGCLHCCVMSPVRPQLGVVSGTHYGALTCMNCSEAGYQGVC